MQSVPITTNVSLNPAQGRCTRSSLLVVFFRYSVFLHQLNWLPRYNWNFVESGLKHLNPNPHTSFQNDYLKFWPTNQPVLAVDDRHVAFCEYNGSMARIICVAVATLANEKLLKCASDNDLLLCRKSTSNKTRCRQWFDRCITSKRILKSGSNWLFPVVFSVEITLSWSHSGNSFEFSHRLTDFLNYALFCVLLSKLESKTSKLFHNEKVKHGKARIRVHSP